MITLSSFKNIFGNTITTTDGDVSVKFDGIISSSESHSQTVTSRPVEDGYEAQDAIHQTPPRVEISIIIADNMQSVADIGKISALANIGGFNIVNSNASVQLNKLEQIYSLKKPVNITTKYREYKEYWIEDRSFEETADDGIIVNLSLIKRVVNKQEANEFNYSNALGIFK